MKQKKLPGFVKNRLVFAFFQSKAGRLFSNWVLQGMLIMNPVEVLYKLGLDAVLTVTLWTLFIGDPTPAGWIAAWVLAHTLNWIINCQPVALCFHLDWGKNDIRRFIDYVEALEKRIQGRSYLAAAASFGSLSRGKYSDRSDIDIRVVMQSGILDRLRAANFCFWERLRAAFSLFPLDLYAFDLEEMRRKMKHDEVPVVFWDPQGLLTRTYRETVAFSAFRDNFRRNIPENSKAGSVCVVCSAGGHLSEALAATAVVGGQHYYVTYDEPHVRSRLAGEEVYYVVDPHVSLPLYLKNAWQSLRIYWRKRPQAVVTTGAGIALATCLLAKLTGTPLIFIESGARVTTLSRTGKLLYPFADLFIVQWKPLLKRYPKAIYGGPLL